MDQTALIELIQRSRQGDPEAREGLVRLAQNRVYYHCKKMLVKEADAQDATQEVLITMLTSLDKLREPAAFWGWVNGITSNYCKHILSASHREWQLPENEEGGTALDSMESLDEQIIPDKALDNEETRRMILGLVDSLPPEQRMTVLFYYYDEMGVKEIARAMDTSEGTVKSRLNYARKSIKKGVEDYERKGVKLYSASPLLLLAYFLRQEAEASGLDAATAAAMAGRVIAQSGGTAALEGAASAAAAGTGSAPAGAAAGTAGGISTKLIAGIAAVVVAVGGAAVGLSSLGSQEAQPSQSMASPEAAAQPSAQEAQPSSADLPFAQAHGFPIVEPRAYEGLPVTLILGDPALVALPSTSAITQPSISASGPDGDGYVTYTVTYDITARSHLGATGSGTAISCSILAQEYNLYDYYTGRLYQPEGPETGTDGESRASGTATVRHNGETFELFYEKRWQSSMAPGNWTDSTQAGLDQELYIDSAMAVTVVVRAPADYDGVLLGVNVEDPADPSKEIREDWNLETDDPAHYQFIRLSDCVQ